MQFEDRITKMEVLVNDTTCRLCLKTPLSEFTLIDETAKEKLGILLVKMDLDGSTKPLMCNDCAGIVKRSLAFKSLCTDTEEMLVDTALFKADSDNVNVCRFCIRTVKEGQFIPLEDLIKDDNTFSVMIKEYMVDMDLNITKNPLICVDCRDNMETYFKFLQTCHDTEEKTNTRETNNTANGQTIMFVSVPEIKEEFDSDIEESLRNVENGDTNENKPCMCDTKDSCKCFRCHVDLDEVAPALEYIKVENVPLEVNNTEIKTETEKLEIKNEVNLSESASQQEQLGNVDEAQLFKCDKCEFKTNYDNALKRHMLVHRDYTEEKMYQCENCGYQTKYEASLKKHMLVHEKPSEVLTDSCEYRTKRKWTPKKQKLNSAEEKMYQCDSCEYHSKFKSNLKRHELTHKDSSEEQIHQCDQCTYQAHRKGILKSHIRMAHSKLSKPAC